jgi:exonuclease III
LNISIPPGRQVADSSGSLSSDGIPDDPLFVSLNCNSLRGKHRKLQQYVDSYDIAVMALQETKIGPSVKCEEIAIDNYTLFRKDRNMNGGGVALFIRNDLPTKSHHSPSIATLGDGMCGIFVERP